jgi:uncharacterized protein YbdZ (MbtH family)
MHNSEKEDTRIYKVVSNDEEQYSIWLDYQQIPLGWKYAGKTGTKAECLAYVKEVWTDMTPLSVRKSMEALEKDPPKPPTVPQPNIKSERTLVDRLCEGDHPVEVALRPERTLKTFQEAIDRDYVHIKFTQTKGGTELGFRLERNLSDLSRGDFENGKGNVHLEGRLTYDYVKVKCVADIDLSTLQGTGHLEKVEETRAAVV